MSSDQQVLEFIGIRTVSSSALRMNRLPFANPLLANITNVHLIAI